ncbi:YhgE/Pip domain-containing protein [Longibaculum muris]|uniref:YhgE/Pip domain-containing protein n=1 Tax=Longibaculum muris TaxID=1796628 RepID=UPI00189EA917|nr:YhgE/Pip domain-containing protein [Longibaculum muris]
MVRQEWKNIFHNAWIIVVIIAIIAIPSIYSCVFLGSMWDPYGNTGEIPVAVVNEDKEVTYNDSSLAVGEELVKNLEDNDSMNFHFVNAEDANKGLEKGDYYMVITIPENFSKNATTLLDDQPQKMILNYTTNPGTNYIASKMDDSAIAKIKAEVSSSVTKTYAQTIFEQIGTLSDGLGEASDGTNKLSDGVNQLVDGNHTISDNLKVLASSSLTFKDGADTLNKGLKDYTDGVLTVHNGVYTLKNGLDTLNSSTGALESGILQLNEGAQSLNKGINAYTLGVNQAYKGTQELVDKGTELRNGAKALSVGTQELVNGNQAVVDGIGKISAMVQANQKELEDYQKLISTLQNSNNPQYIALANMITTNGLKLEDNKELKEDFVKLGITKDLPSYSKLIDQVNEGMKTLNLAINSQLLSGAQEVQAGLNQVNSKVNEGEKSLVNGINAYTAGVSKVNSGLSTITANNSTLTNGASQLANGTAEIQKQTPTLISGVKALDSGASQLYMGTSQLVSNNRTLVGGAAQLSGGAGQISSGAGQLADGSSTLGSGLNEVKNGVTTLNTSLKDGAEQSKISTNDDTFEMMASPVDTSHKEISVVENNGHAMAPYMMSVALYVCGLAFTLMYPIRYGIKEAKSSIKYWASKATVMYTVSTLAAVVMISCLRFINGFEPQQLLMTYLFAIIVSAAFMSIIVLLNLTTGFIGEFLLLVFMIINLGGSAGTYPLETSASFFKSIHYFVPYTYSVDGFRKVISMANASLTTEIWVFVGIFVVCSILTICYYQFKHKEDKHIIPQAFEKVNEE